MELAFAIDYIPRRMKELGYEHYAVRYRHIRVIKQDTTTIEAGNSLMLAINPDPLWVIKSKAGIFKLGDDSVNEQQYEHRGKIAIKNGSDLTGYALFIQVIPLHRNNRSKTKTNGRDSASI